jgi:hypothetical protein
MRHFKVLAAKRPSLYTFALIVLVVGSTAGCSDEPLPVPALPQKSADDPWFDERPPLLKWDFLKRGAFQSPNATLVLRNKDPFAWTMLDQIRVTVVTPNAPRIRRRRMTIERSVELRCPPPASVPPGGLLVIAYKSCVVPWEGFYDGTVRIRPSSNTLDDPEARAYALRVVAREGIVSVDLGDGPRIFRESNR